MSEKEWFDSIEPDLMLECVVGRASRAQLIEFVRLCWQRIAAHLPATHGNYTVVDEFAALAYQMNDHDAALYAAEAALKAARWAPVFKEEKRQQALLLRQVFAYPSERSAS
ncbi:hypothetical protein BH10PLA2_BH10PLA2_03720 [soil metagenome]